MGRCGIIAHNERYDRVDEYLDVLYKLREGSWEDGAVVRDRKRRAFADPSKVHKLDHRRRYYEAEGDQPSEPSPQRTPVLFRA